MGLMRNQLLDSICTRERARLESLGQVIELGQGEVLQHQDGASRDVFFPVGALVSLIASVRAITSGVELAMIGSEGMLGVQLALGVERAPLNAVVQGSGAALRVSAADFASELAGDSSLQEAVRRYSYVLMRQMATAAACVHAYPIAPRLAKWMLMTQDHVGSRSFHVTQEFLRYMLGVRRVGVTSAARALRDRGLIDYHRGYVTVLDRKAVRAAACSCYAADRLAYTRVFKSQPQTA